MADSTISITGQLNLANAGLPIPEYKIELWDSVDDGYGWLASTPTRITGHFSFIINDPIAALIVGGTILLKCRIYKNDIFISDVPVPDYTLPIVAAVSEDKIDKQVVDTINEDTIVPYIKISGTVFDINGVPLLDTTVVNVYENGFRTKFLLASANPFLGKYQVKINSKSISNTQVIANRSICIEVVDPENTILATSGNISSFDALIEINFNTGLVNSYSEFDKLKALISAIIGEEVTVDSLTEDEIKYVAEATGENINAIQTYITANVIVGATEVKPELIYALLTIGGRTVENIIYTDLDTATDSITAAVEKNIIATPSPADIDTLIQFGKLAQIEYAVAYSVIGEDYRLADVLLAIFPLEEDVVNFLTAYNKTYESRTEFWVEYASEYGDTLANLGQLGIKLAAITCFQPQTIAQAISVLGTDDIIVIGGWTFDDWKNIVAETCLANEKLCVPFSIRGDETDPGNIEIQEAYAWKLLGIGQSLYPMGYVLSQLNGDEGESLIPDEDIRTQVIEFINRYPDFDPRIKTVNNINAETYDLSGITDDPATLISGLVPFQRMFRVVGGNPRAVCDLIINGINSARDISLMSVDQFTDNYGYLFPPIIKDEEPIESFKAESEENARYLQGLAPIIPIVYGTALTISAVTKSFITNTLTAALETTTKNFIIDQSEIDGEGVEDTMPFSTHKLSHSPLLMAYTDYGKPPVTPAVFKGGYIPLPGDDPAFSSLFSNLDYCACSDCMSVYSPAAYLADILNFLQSNSTSTQRYYDALIQTRRPDIVNIDLTCKNTNTPMPYIDLIIELLELQVLKSPGTPTTYIPGGVANFSFQTSGTAEQLAAYPEHVYKPLTPAGAAYLDYTAFTVGTAPIVNPYQSVYDATNLLGAAYPYNLPFHLPLEESRTYLQHLGISRVDLMKQFNPFNQLTSPPSNDIITNYAIYAEFLGLNQFAAIIVTGDYAPTTSTPWIFYGAVTSPSTSPTMTSAAPFADPMGIPGTLIPAVPTHYIDVLCSRIDVLLQQTNIDYDELLQFLTTDYLNPFVTTQRRAYIIAVTGAPVDTCQLNQLKLVFSDVPTGLPSNSIYSAAFFNKLHRFIRLTKSAKLSIYQWDIVLRSMNNISNITNANFQQIGKFLMIADQLNIAPEILAMWYSSADNKNYLDYPNGSINPLPSVFDNIFSNESVVNNASNNFFQSPTSLPTTYVGYTAQIANFAGIQEDEVISLLAYLSVSLTSAVTSRILSRLYIIGQLSRSWGYSIADLITILKLCPKPPVTPPLPLSVPLVIPWDAPQWVTAGGSLNDYLKNLQYFADVIYAIKISGFTVSEINYLVSNSDPSDTQQPNDTTIALFLESIRNELQKNVLYPMATATPADQALLLNKLTNILYQHFSKEFNISLQIVTDIFTASPIVVTDPTNKFVSYFLNNDFIKGTYALSRQNVTYIDTLTAGSTIPIPPAAAGSSNKVPNFKIHLLYNWYLFFYKVSFISQKLNLRTAEFEYLFLPQAGTTGRGVNFDFKKLPVTSVGTTPVLADFNDTPITISLNDALYGLLRTSHVMDVVKAYSLQEDGLGKLLDAVSGIIRPASPTGTPIVVNIGDPAYLTEINTCFTNLLGVLNQDAWTDMLYQLIGNQVPSSGYTKYGTVDGKLNTYFTVDTAVSNYTATSYNNISNLLTIKNIIYWCQRIGLSPTTTQPLLIENISPLDSRNLIVAAKGKYDDSAWAEIAKPLRDTIRVKQRNALVAYLRTKTNNIFAYLLIDAEMDACMTTSRIKQAISSVQLFIDRMLLGLESYSGTLLTLTPQMMNQWQLWRKWYGVWEANRKIFFYPEDWLQPELRDDKSIFFQEMETQLKQDDITIERVQQAMRDYLVKLDDVARLEPVGMCDDTVSGATHVFARTYGASHRYYHRTVVGGIWSSWDRVDIDIASDHVIPFIWQNRLFLFWLSFQDKQALVPSSISSVQVSNPLGTDRAAIFLNNKWFYNTQDEVLAESTGSTGQSNGVANANPKFYYKQIEITLNWSEYKNAKWQNQSVGKEKMTLKVSPWLLDQLYMHVFNPTYGGTPPVYTLPVSGTVGPTAAAKNKETLLFDYLMNNGKETLTDFIKTRITVFPYIGTTSASPLFRPVSPSSAPVNPGDLYLLVSFPSYLEVWNPNINWTNDEATYIKCFHSSDISNGVDVPDNVMFYHRTTPPQALYFKNMAMQSYPGTAAAGASNALPGYLVRTPPSPASTAFYRYDQEVTETTTSWMLAGPSFNILNSSIKPRFRIMPKINYAKSPVEDKFMFEDGVNTYFVFYQTSAININPYYIIGIDSSSTAAGGFYGIGGGGSFSAFKSSLAKAGFAPPVPVNKQPLPDGGITPTVYPGPNYGGPVTGAPGSGIPSTGGPTASDGVLASPMLKGITSLKKITSFSQSKVQSMGIGGGILPGGTSIYIGGSTPPPSTLTVGRYVFQTFYHPHVKDFIKTLNQFGIDGLMRPDLLTLSGIPTPIVQTWVDDMQFSIKYQPTSYVDSNYPKNELDFSFNGPYAVYNWELFFHLPMTMALRMSENKQFYDAQKWFHYIFDPTSNKYMAGSTPVPPAAPGTQKYWKFYPFFLVAAGSITTIAQLLAQVALNNAGAVAQVTASNNDPFQPFAIARMRPVAFMKYVVMKYLDNLIAWGDSLFMQDTIESINEATNLYIMASNILGEKPVEVPQRTKTASYSYKQMPAHDALGNASVPLESYVDPGPASISITPTGGTPTNVLYFCLAPNDQLLTYWDTVADRLYKIRHCQNIDGVVQRLPLFDPPINPALLVQAAASGVDVNSVLNDISGANTPNYRFTYMVQKANEFCGDVKALGGALLSAMEKSDGEQLAALRSGQELNVQKAMLLLKQLQINEALANLEALKKTKDNTQARFDYYNSRTFMNDGEHQYLASLQTGINIQIAQTVMQQIGHALSLIPQFHLQGPFAIGASYGGKHLGLAFEMINTQLACKAAINNVKGTMASTKGGYQRRMDDWQFQANSAKLELTQIDKQIDAANIRIQITQQDYANQQLQIENAASVDAFMRTKYTNAELYDWMKGQIATTYFQAYQLAYNMAKKAEQCYIRELPLSTLAQNGLIKPNSWDSLRKGLLSGERLQYDIRNMESAYITDNKRTLELTKHVSLLSYFAKSLVTLRRTGTCTIDLPEDLFDMDYPGHYNRIIKSLSISIPCVAGPYTTIPCTLSITQSYIRRKPTVSSAQIDSITNTPCQAVATSSGQNDSGMFDFNFRDERYLPFEGHGAICTVTIDLGGIDYTDAGVPVRILPFDFNTISDAILHIKYTAVDGASTMDGANTFGINRSKIVRTNITTAVLGKVPMGAEDTPPIAGGTALELPRGFSLKHEFPNEWFAYVNDVVSLVTNPKLSITLNSSHFPFFCKGHSVYIKKIYFATRLKSGVLSTYTIDVSDTAHSFTAINISESPTITSPSALNLGPINDAAASPTDLNMQFGIIKTGVSAPLNIDVALDDIYMVVVYQANV